MEISGDSSLRKQCGSPGRKDTLVYDQAYVSVTVVGGIGTTYVKGGSHNRNIENFLVLVQALAVRQVGEGVDAREGKIHSLAVLGLCAHPESSVERGEDVERSLNSRQRF